MPVLTTTRRYLTATFWLALWVLAISVGLFSLMAHENRPGDTEVPPSEWVAEAPFPRATDRPTLLFFAHPSCPCLRASLAELENLLAANRSPVRVYVVVFAPEQPGVSQSGFSTQLRIISHQDIRYFADPGGRTALRFGVLTSGDCLLYGTTGRLIYRGGITSARGQHGPSIERATLAQLINNPTKPDLVRMPVFGCPLFDSLPSTAGR